MGENAYFIRGFWYIYKDVFDKLNDFYEQKFLENKFEYLFDRNRSFFRISTDMSLLRIVRFTKRI